jgi:hypothetical protein
MECDVTESGSVGWVRITGGDTSLLAVELRREDNRLSATDALVAAAALACEDCSLFYTNDPQLLGCRPLLARSRDKGMVVREVPG